MEQRRRQADDPENRQQHDDAENQRKAEAELAGLPGLLRRQLLRGDGEENHIVDAENNFQGAERDEARPNIRIQ